MFRTARALAMMTIAAGLAMPAICRAEDKVPAPADNATGNTAPKLDSMDQQFILKAANGGMAEVKLGKLAADQGRSQAVKDFGKKMVEDHTKANDKLKELASSKGVTLPMEVTGKEKECYDKMVKCTDAEFDKTYVEAMIKDHRQDIMDFKKEASSGKDADVKTFAADTLPTLKEHMKLINQVAKNSGDDDLAKMASEKQSPDDSK